MSKHVEGVENNGFEYHNSLLDFYIHTDLEKANSLAEEMLAQEFTPPFMKRIKFSMANIKLFERNYESAMSSYQQVLKMIPDDKLKAYTLNNMALTGIEQVKNAERSSKGIDISPDDQKAILSTFKESIKLLENLPENKIQEKKKKNFELKQEYIDEILDLKTVIPEEYSTENEERYLGLITHRDSGRVMSNISEYLLTHEKQNPLNIAFWFKLGLNHYEKYAPELIDRHLILLGLFYSASNQPKVAEAMYMNALKKLKNDVSYTKAMGLNMYGRMLLKNPARKDQGMMMLQQSEQIMTVLPYWHDKIDSVAQFNVQ